MFELDDPVAKRLVLEQLLQADDENKLSGDLGPDLLDALRNRSLHDLIRIAEMKQLAICVSLNASAILSCFKRLDVMKRYQELLEYFVRNWATPEMMSSLFRIAPADLRTMRSKLCHDKHAGGRPSMPTLSEREEIYRQWIEISRTQVDTREQYYVLHQRFPHYALAALWATVHELSRIAHKSPAVVP